MAVIDNAFETKGTHLFFADTFTSSDPTVVKLTCPTGVDGVNGGTKDRIDTTCLDETGSFRTSIDGFADPSDLTVPFILYKGDGSHEALFGLQNSSEKIGWMVGLSDSASVPTLSGLDLVPPVDRTAFTLMGSVANVTLSIGLNDVVRGNLTIRPSGFTTPHWVV